MLNGKEILRREYKKGHVGISPLYVREKDWCFLTVGLQFVSEEIEILQKDFGGEPRMSTKNTYGGRAIPQYVFNDWEAVEAIKAVEDLVYGGWRQRVSDILSYADAQNLQS